MSQRDLSKISLMSSTLRMQLNSGHISSARTALSNQQALKQAAAFGSRPIQFVYYAAEGAITPLKCIVEPIGRVPD